MHSIPLLALSTALVGLLCWDPTGPEAPAPEPCCAVPARKPVIREELLVEPDADPRSVIVVDEEQATPAPQLSAPRLPSGLLLDADATDEEYAKQHAGLRADELVRLAHRIQVYQDHADEGQAVALVSERTWLDQERVRRLSEPFHGALPANLHDRDADHEKAFANMSVEDMKVVAFRVDHAFKFERERLAAQRFASGLHKSRPAPSADSWRFLPATHSVRVVEEDGKRIEHYVEFEEDDDPLLYALARKSEWLTHTISQLGTPTVHFNFMLSTTK